MQRGSRSGELESSHHFCSVMWRKTSKKSMSERWGEVEEKDEEEGGERCI